MFCLSYKVLKMRWTNNKAMNGIETMELHNTFNTGKGGWDEISKIVEGLTNVLVVDKHKKVVDMTRELQKIVS